MAESAENIASDYGVNKKFNMSGNPQANSIIQRIHQTIGNMMRSFRCMTPPLMRKTLGLGFSVQ
eukprot:10182663-Ditylum_brightwellii.AAC.1